MRLHLDELQRRCRRPFVHFGNPIGFFVFGLESQLFSDVEVVLAANEAQSWHANPHAAFIFPTYVREIRLLDRPEWSRYWMTGR